MAEAKKRITSYCYVETHATGIHTRYPLPRYACEPGGRYNRCAFSDTVRHSGDYCSYKQGWTCGNPEAREHARQKLIAQLDKMTLPVKDRQKRKTET